MRKQIQITLAVIVLLSRVAVTGAFAQRTDSSSSSKMSNQQTMDKMNHMSSTEKAVMFDKMTNSQKMEAMKMAGHDMSTMSHQERMNMMSKITPEEKAGMFDKMSMDTKMATMKKSMAERKAEK